MAETERKDGDPVAWRYLRNAPKAKWVVQTSWPAGIEKWPGYTIEPLVPRSDYLAAVAGWKRASELLDAAVGDYNTEHDRLTAAEAKIAEQAAEIERLQKEAQANGALRICPERDAICPHGATCQFAKDGYHCDIAASRAALAEIGSGK